MKKSFYCGTFAGRPSIKDPGFSPTKPDKSDRDLKFSRNIKLRLLTPEYLFHNLEQKGVGENKNIPSRRQVQSTVS